MSKTRRFPGFRIPSIGLITALFMVSIIALVACGGGGGGGDDEDGMSQREKAIANSPALQTIEALGGTSSPAASVAASPTPVREITMDEAKKQLWVFLSKCITLDTTDIEAVQVEGNWYVRGSLRSNHETGLWEVPNAGQSVQPYDERAKEWLETVEGGCTPEKMRIMTTPIPPTPVVSGAAAASAAVWGYLVRCVSELSKDNVHAQENPLESEWIITTDEVLVDALGREANFGAWSVSYEGVITTKDSLAQVWNAYVFPTTKGEECAKQYVPNILYALPSPTPIVASTPVIPPTVRPVPTPTPKIRGASEAVNSVWAYLIPCFAGIDISDFKATYDSSNVVWVVVQVAGATTSTWSVANNGVITATNTSSRANEAIVKARSC